MSNILAANNTAASSSDQTVGSTGQVLIFLTDADGGYVGQDVQVNIELKAASGQYMRQSKVLRWDSVSFDLYAPPGTPFRVTRIAGPIEVHAKAVE